MLLKESLLYGKGGGIYKINKVKNRELTEFELHLYKLCSTTLLKTILLSPASKYSKNSN
jgi:hypothetical protein